MIRFNRWKLMSEALALLGLAASIEAALEVLRARSRAIGCADGVAVVRRDGDEMVHVGEDAVAPLWTGRRFPIDQCVSGLAMTERRPIYIPDVQCDARVPRDVEEVAFVASMAMFPLGIGDPVAALGVYWAKDNPAEPDALALLDTLARSANSTFERLAIAREIAESRPGA
ncbi:MAG: sensor hybrid histidine kinase [Sphingomonas bacterium]|uniref:GAF domain-containing protein n=1 Tax=Sphingomonas bacterium TaxID=1895847 RepID=UPI00260F9E75|nr:GAF domain-containing protein [Sphingomonas bacterium]MDB5708358.1 sensor hybrid histidine kinase [Sphingomonas bacterium]